MTERKLLEIAARVEQEPPSRELDAEIAATTRRFYGQPVPTWFTNWDGELRAMPDGRVVAIQSDGREGPWLNASHYTTSLDAAASLMSEGWIVEIWISRKRDRAVCKARKYDAEWKLAAEFSATAPTEPQARTAAALRAMEAEGG